MVPLFFSTLGLKLHRHMYDIGNKSFQLSGKPHMHFSIQFMVAGKMTVSLRLEWFRQIEIGWSKVRAVWWVF
jgi:hypothetical protein